jgi:hypothetical protein
MRRMNRRAMPVAALLLVGSAISSTATADTSMIGPTDLGAPFYGHSFGPFDNEIPEENIHQKLFSFTGTASNPSDNPVTIEIQFGFLTNPTTGQNLAPGYPNVLPPHSDAHPITAGPLLLPFCPEQVTIDIFEEARTTKVTVQGTFTHTCLVIPEPASASLICLGLAALIGTRRWHPSN